MLLAEGDRQQDGFRERFGILEAFESIKRSLTFTHDAVSAKELGPMRCALSLYFPGRLKRAQSRAGAA